MPSPQSHHTKLIVRRRRPSCSNGLFACLLQLTHSLRFSRSSTRRHMSSQMVARESDPWRQQSRPGAGYSVYGLCETQSSAEFWLFAPLIALGRAESVHVQINFMMRSCEDHEVADSRNGSCRESFDVFLQQEALHADMDDAAVPKTQSFKKLATISSDRKWSSKHPTDEGTVTSWLIRFRPIRSASSGSIYS
ncbi:unnamed protein product [Mesocestoides corti]|uniref:Eph LBD domain-containing protein n=2 Tax=Mesocestoides corti TaxID=53468 RepID=A0A0R3UNS5_MESCO|nr:unnamed protein product [Mesocestoides corti]